MARVLFLDDDKHRHDGFQRLMVGQGHVVVRVETAKQAIEALGGQQFGVAFLDHDLGGEQMVGSGPGTGYEVAQHIAGMKRSDRPVFVVVHSFNPVGAENMVEVLRAAGVPAVHHPFGSAVFVHRVKGIEGTLVFLSE